MEENKTIETTQPKKKKFPIGRIIFLLLVCVAAYFIWQNHVEKQREIEANTVRYEDVMNDPYTEEDIIILDAVRELQTFAEFVAQNPDPDLYLCHPYYVAGQHIVWRLHHFRVEDEVGKTYDLSYAYLSPKAAVRVDEACRGIMFDDLSDRGKLEYVAICKEIYAALGKSYNIFDIGEDCHDMDKSLERFRIVRETEAVEEPPKELTATQQKIAEWKEAFLAWSAEVQAKNRERLNQK